MNWIINKIKRCVSCVLTVLIFMGLTASNFYTYKTARAWTLEEVCGDISYYHANDKDLIKIRQCEGK